MAALLERAYRLALWLQDAERAPRSPRPAGAGRADRGGEGAHPDETGETDPSPASFAIQVASAELVEVLDEARARLVAGMTAAPRITAPVTPPVTPAGTPTPVRSSAPPDR